MFKFVLGLVVAVAIAGTAYAAAETLIVDAGVAQSGVSDSLVCDEDGVQVYKTTAGATDDTIDSITIAGIDSDCEGGIKVGLTGTFGSFEAFNGAIPNGNLVLTGPFGTPGVTIEELQAIHVTFY